MGRKHNLQTPSGRFFGVWHQVLEESRALGTNKKCPCAANRPGRDKWGWEFATLSFPNRHWAPFWGCRVPDAILHGKRSFGLVAGPSPVSGDAE